MTFRLAALLVVLCAVGYSQANRVIGNPDFPYRYGRVTPSSIYTPDCSATSQTPPNPADASPEDFVELERSLCFGACPAYRVRLYRTGKVDWLPGNPVLMQALFDTNPDPAEAAPLLDRASAPEFWSACKVYPIAAEDAPTYNLRLNIAGKQATVQFGYDTGLNWLDAFTADLDRMVDTHRRFHGDPATEDLSHIPFEVSLSKRSMTPLMKAAAADDLEKISELLAAGALVDEQDASGWTALMYAGGRYAGRAVSALLQAGANPNHKDFAGRTPLMASANGPGYEKILIAVENVNGQSKSGLTALMLMAKSANSERVRHALANGADPSIPDAAGQTAWDYLMQSYCGRVLSPTPGDPRRDVSADDAQHCFELDRLLKVPKR